MAAAKTERLLPEVAYFSSDSHLLAELGERLVGTPAIALAELIKNAYDADATVCHVWYEKGAKPKLHVADDGHGMTKDEFLHNWMVVATDAKRTVRESRTFKRPLTGAKGVGRFAARFLGNRLDLETHSVRDQEGAGLLKATFDWPTFEDGGDLTKIPVTYTYETGGRPPKTRTTLTISNLRQEFTPELEKEVRRQVLKICTPISVLDPGELVRSGSPKDPGFDVFFSAPGEEKREKDTVAAEILENALARLSIAVKDNKAEYEISFKDEIEDKKPKKKGDEFEEVAFEHTERLKENLIGRLYADIRFLPRIRGAFSGFENIKGPEAIDWFRDHSGVKIYDHGFQIVPYGEGEDDWLRLSADTASRARQWRSTIAERLYPKDEQSTIETESPFLVLAGNHQLIGAVFLQTVQIQDAKADRAPRQLQVAMDRQGYLNNEGFTQLFDVVRAGLEFLAVSYREYMIKREKKRVAEQETQLRKQFKETIQRISRDTKIPAKERTQIVRQVARLEKQTLELDESHRRVRESVELMGLLGGLAGFLTHETESLSKNIAELVSKMEAKRSALKQLGLEEIFEEAKQLKLQLKDQLDYARTFLQGTKVDTLQRLNARVQINRVVEKLKSFAKPRGIEPDVNIDDDLETPPTLATMYSGIVLNLYTNAIKAVLDENNKTGQVDIKIEAKNQAREHVIRVSDTGVGIPGALEDRIFDPLFSTTQNSPLGPGMGLGLTIVRRILTDLGGSIDLVKPEKGFNTCFEVRMPLK